MLLLVLLLKALCRPLLCGTQMLASGNMVDLIIQSRMQNRVPDNNFSLMRLVESVYHTVYVESCDITCPNTHVTVLQLSQHPY